MTTVLYTMKTSDLDSIPDIAVEGVDQVLHHGLARRLLDRLTRRSDVRSVVSASAKQVKLIGTITHVKITRSLSHSAGYACSVGGSTTKASSPAPNICPSSSAFAKSCSLMIPPRDVLIKIDVGFISCSCG